MTRTRERVRIGQLWVERADKSTWRVHQIHRRDGLVELRAAQLSLGSPIAQPRLVAFHELARRYREAE
jgi:hypothetical protein